MKLQVTRNDAIADGINLFECRDADGSELPQFSAGAHIGIQAPNGMLRKYSLCNDPAERDRYQVAVDQDETGSAGGLNCGAGGSSNDPFSGSTEYCGRGDRRILPQYPCWVHPPSPLVKQVYQPTA